MPCSYSYADYVEMTVISVYKNAVYDTVYFVTSIRSTCNIVGIGSRTATHFLFQDPNAINIQKICLICK